MLHCIKLHEVGIWSCDCLQRLTEGFFCCNKYQQTEQEQARKRYKINKLTSLSNYFIRERTQRWDLFYTFCGNFVWF